MTDEVRSRLQFARDRISMTESRMESLANDLRGWNVGRIVKSWVENALRPAREALDEILGPNEDPPAAESLENVA